MRVVLADDLSGAAEVGNAALSRGCRVSLLLDASEPAAADVVCINMETRALKEDAARARAAEFARLVQRWQPRHVFVKCDSVLRGHVGGESRVIAEVLGKDRILLLPANPSRGRLIRQGRYFIGGAPLDRTEFARDPEFPRRSAEVATLVGGDLTGITIPDVEDERDVQREVQRLDSTSLPVGGVDFFLAWLAREHSLPATPVPPRIPRAAQGRTLLICGSLAAWRGGRPEECERHAVPMFALPLEQASDAASAAAQAAWERQINEALDVRKIALVATASSAAHQVLTRMASFLIPRIPRWALNQVGVEGGATAAALLRAWNCRRLELTHVCPPGLAALQAHRPDVPLLLVKPGSYPWPEEIFEADAMGSLF